LCQPVRFVALVAHYATPDFPLTLIHINIRFFCRPNTRASDQPRILPLYTIKYTSGKRGWFLYSCLFCPYSPVTSLASWSNRLLLRGACWTRHQLFAVRRWTALESCSPLWPGWRQLPSQNYPRPIARKPRHDPRDSTQAMHSMRRCCSLHIIETVSAGAQSTCAGGSGGDSQPATTFHAACR
jgi:hypothetical protein